ncbi:PH domain-containing protein [Actinosynnema mirum]|uniref:PH domain-containing protein n=1 Tax=Actinosynnema mirum TaxID=40567 RepID=UPI0003240037|nr:PH domain-containing protein [Actinosynnema mirum]
MPKLVFRVPATALLASGLTAICVTPMALAEPVLSVLYLLPLGFAWWVARTRTTATPERLVTRTAFGGRVVAWDEVRSLKVGEKGGLSAVVADDELVELPAVKLAHLPALAAVSGGRVDDPVARAKALAEAEEARAEAEAEAEAEAVEAAESTEPTETTEPTDQVSPEQVKKDTADAGQSTEQSTEQSTGQSTGQSPAKPVAKPADEV